MIPKHLNITLDALANKVRELALARPDFNYRQQPERLAWESGKFDEGEWSDAGCSYLGAFVPDGSSEYKGEGCIIGQALTSLGVDRIDLAGFEGESVREIVHAFGMVDMREATAPNKLVWLLRMQGNQDAGCLWGDAIINADLRVGTDFNIGKK